MLSFIPIELVHTALILSMIVLLISRRKANRRDLMFRIRIDQAGLRAALVAEFRSLETALALNAAMLEADCAQGFPGRPFLAIYRGNMSRLLLLTAPEIAAVVATQGASDTLDAAVALGVSQRRGFRGQQAVIEPHPLDVAALQADAARCAREAIAVLEAAAVAVPPPIPSWWARISARLLAARQWLEAAAAQIWRGGSVHH